MTIELKESFQVHSPIDEVWALLMSPDKLAACMPGASITELIDKTQFKGAVKLRVGAISVQYAGVVTYTKVDENDHATVMTAEARDTGGGTVTGTITTRLNSVSDETTEAHVEANFDLTGRLVQVGRGMIDGVSARIIGQFVNNIKTHLEAEQTDIAAAAEATVHDPTPSANNDEDSINILALIGSVVVTGIKNFFLRLFRRKS